jgi:CHAT domain-containing protein
MKSIFYTSSILCSLFLLVGCDLIQMKKDQSNGDVVRQPVARANNAYLYKDELSGIIPAGTLKEDSAARIEAYIESWIRKQLLLQQAAKKININEAEVERKILDYRYSIIAYEYQSQYIKQHLDTAISETETEHYYRNNIDNFVLKQNIVRATFIKIPKNAPKANKIKDLLFSTDEKEKRELKSYCLSFAVAYHITDSSWIVFDDLVRNSPVAEIPNKVQFLKANPYYQTDDENYSYFLKVQEYKISDNISPLDFVRDEIKNIILNKRKVELAKKLEDEIYNNALSQEEFEVIRQ